MTVDGSGSSHGLAAASIHRMVAGVLGLQNVQDCGHAYASPWSLRLNNLASGFALYIMNVSQQRQAIDAHPSVVCTSWQRWKPLSFGLCSALQAKPVCMVLNKQDLAVAPSIGDVHTALQVQDLAHPGGLTVLQSSAVTGVGAAAVLQWLINTKTEQIKQKQRR